MFEIFDPLPQRYLKLNKTEQKQAREVFLWKDVLQNSAKLTVTHLRWILFFLKIICRPLVSLFLIALQASGSESLYQTACIKISFFYILILFVCLFINFLDAAGLFVIIWVLFHCFLLIERNNLLTFFSFESRTKDQIVL